MFEPGRDEGLLVRCFQNPEQLADLGYVWLNEPAFFVPQHETEQYQQARHILHVVLAFLVLYQIDEQRHIDTAGRIEPNQFSCNLHLPRGVALI